MDYIIYALCITIPLIQLVSALRTYKKLRAYKKAGRLFGEAEDMFDRATIKFDKATEKFDRATKLEAERVKWRDHYKSLASMYEEKLRELENRSETPAKEPYPGE